MGRVIDCDRRAARRFLLRTLWSIRRRVCGQVLLAVAERLTGLAGIVLLGVAVDQMIAGGSVAVLAAAIAALAVAEAFAAAAHAKQAILACCEVYVPVRQRLVDAAHQRDDAFNDRFGSADLLTRAGLDSEQVDILVAELGRLAGAGALCIAGIAVGFVLDLWTGGVVAALVAVMTVAVALVGAPLYTTTLTRSRASSALNGLFTATLRGLATVGGLGLAGNLLERERGLADDCHRAGVDLARVHSRIDALVRLASALGLAGLAAAVVVASAGGRLSPGQAVTGLGLLGIVLVSATEVSEALTQLLSALAGAGRLAEVLDHIARPDPSDDGRVSITPGAPPEVELRGLRFSYPAQPGREVIEGIDLTIAAGQLVALAGRSGSGKTTVLRLLARSFDPTGGRVLLAGRDLRDIAQAQLPRLLAVADQRPFLYDDALVASVALGRPHATRAEVFDVLRRSAAADLAVDVQDRRVGRRGANLSGGQRRRVVLARALLPSTGLLLLDDPTASLDPATEQQVAAELSRMRGGTTLVVATNRASVLRHADQVVLLGSGRVLTLGSHAELLASCADYRDLVGEVGFDDL
ncbi:MAG: ABC transporter ATP-binding protein [Egibacteraceae bacterium]